MSSSEVGLKFVFWVVYDTTGDRQFVKMDGDTGCLAMFDNEESAAAFASGLFGVGYKKVVLYSCPQPADAELEELHKLLMILRGNIGGAMWTLDDEEEELAVRTEKAIAAIATYHKQGRAENE